MQDYYFWAAKCISLKSGIGVVADPGENKTTFIQLFMAYI